MSARASRHAAGQARSAVQRGAGEALPHRDVREHEGVARGLAQEARVQVGVAVEGEPGQPDPVRRRGDLPPAQRLDEVPAQPPGGGESQSAPDHLAEERVRVADGEGPALAGEADQSLGLRLLHRVVAAEVGQHVEVDRFAQRQQLEHVQDGVVEMVDAPVEEGRQLRGHGGAAAHLPDAADLAQRP